MSILQKLAMAAFLQVAIVTTAFGAGDLHKKEEPSPASAAPEEPAPKPDYCANFADEARDARYAWQQKQLKELEAKLEKKIAELDEKRLEYLSWLAKRDAELKKAEAGLVDIYAKMRPDAAAQQLALLDRETAASILRQLRARSASAILNEMEKTPAAQLSEMLALPSNEKRM
jgi:flagellar motility protein MotE (MotC chaperone)